MRLSHTIGLGAALAALMGLASGAQAADPLKTLHLDYAYYNPVSLVLKEKHLVEDAVGPDIKVEWVQSAGSNRALEYLRSRSIDLGSTAGSAALLARANGNPVRIVYVYSKPEWTALVTRADSPIQAVADLKGKRIAATSGTDPGIFLLRALATAGLTSHDVTIVPLQHADGRIALDRGEVDAWSGLDPFMAQAELETHDRLFYRNPDFNTYGVLDVRESFLQAYPEIVAKVVAAYEQGRHWALAHKDELQQILVSEAKLSPTVAARQLERTDLTDPVVGDGPKKSIAGAAEVLKASGIVPADADLDKIEDELLDPDFTKKLAKE
ncbi:MAG TPA: aliphatic sulfonate ABC transporter substrate-binding protein [Stellaceae bacterium]|nr:aliphatic sulfonate ABC transporter substrate-binding protein [Stellaceae bacterium]